MYPRREYHFWVYIMASRSLQLYVGMTTSLKRRVEEHRAHLPGSYTARYNIDRLVYFEHYQYVHSAIARENELKDWNRAKKIALIVASNPTWIDLSEAWRNSGFLRCAAEWKRVRVAEWKKVRLRTEREWACPNCLCNRQSIQPRSFPLAIRDAFTFASDLLFSLLRERDT